MTELSERDLDKIKNLHNRWIGSELDGNETGVVDLCTADVQWLPPDSPPIVGKDEIAKYLATHQVKVEAIDIDGLYVQGSGSLAYLISNYRTQYLTEGHSELHESQGTHLWVLRKEGDYWRVAVVTWSSW